MTLVISKYEEAGIVLEKSDFRDEKQLQEYIRKNPHCIPIKEIKPDANLVFLAREFPVNDIESKKFVDILAIDQDGQIYIIETKLYKNPDKRKVTAQVLYYGESIYRDYKHQEDFPRFQSIIEEQLETSFYNYIKNSFHFDDKSTDQIILNLRNNISNGNFTFLVVMDKFDEDLKNKINFFNLKTDETFAIYGIELAKYEHEGSMLVVPKLFGFEAKEGSKSFKRRKYDRWNEETFLKSTQSKLSKVEYDAVKKLFTAITDEKVGLADDWWYGSGNDATFLPKFYKISRKRSPFQLVDDGTLNLQFQMFGSDDELKKFRNEFGSKLKEIKKLEMPNDYNDDKSIQIPASRWVPVVDEIIKVLRQFVY